MSHTPGPWRWVHCEDRSRETLDRLVGQDDELVCHFGDSEQYYPTEGEEPNDADARLIVAAPDMFEALVAILDRTEGCLCPNNSGGGCEWCNAASYVQSAIDLATGKRTIHNG